MSTRDAREGVLRLSEAPGLSEPEVRRRRAWADQVSRLRVHPTTLRRARREGAATIALACLLWESSELDVDDALSEALQHLEDALGRSDVEQVRAHQRVVMQGLKRAMKRRRAPVPEPLLELVAFHHDEVDRP